MTKYRIFFSMALLAGLLPGQAQTTTEITGFGSSATNPLNTSTDFISPWTGTQTTSSVSVSNVSNQTGGIFSNLATPENISSLDANLTLSGSLNGTAPATNQFQLVLYDSNMHTISYDFTWSSFSGGTQTISAPDVNISSFNGTVTAYGLNLFGTSGQTVSFTFDNLEAGAVPEPSVPGLLLLGLTMLVLGKALRPRRNPGRL